ncbi:hypothetical protein [Kitasatospora sp. NPDC088783]|uniref:hypothetical protein n=1 Tax=Kitasatospora sp. NPDC088783 TaxID=3364077 RepID=UPI003813B5FE
MNPLIFATAAEPAVLPAQLRAGDLFTFPGEKNPRLCRVEQITSLGDGTLFRLFVAGVGEPHYLASARLLTAMQMRRLLHLTCLVCEAEVSFESDISQIVVEKVLCGICVSVIVEVAAA